MDVSFLQLYVGRYCSPLSPPVSSVNWFNSWIWQKAMQSFCLVILCQISVLWKGLKNPGAGRSGGSMQSGKDIGPSLNQLTLLWTHSRSITLLKTGIKYCPAGHFFAMLARNLTLLACCLWLLFTFWHTQLKECKEICSFIIHFYSFLNLSLALHWCRCPLENSVWSLI